MIVAGFLASDPSLVGRREAFVPLGRFLAHRGEVETKTHSMLHGAGIGVDDVRHETAIR